MGGREAPPHFVDEAVFAYYFSLFWVIFGNILKKLPNNQKNQKNTRLHIKCARFARTSGV